LPIISNSKIVLEAIYFTLIDFPMNLLTVMNFGQFQLDAYESTHRCSSSSTEKGKCLDISGLSLSMIPPTIFEDRICNITYRLYISDDDHKMIT